MLCVHRTLVLLRTLLPIPGPQFLSALWRIRYFASCVLVATQTKTFHPSSSFYVKRGYSKVKLVLTLYMQNQCDEQPV